MHNRENIVYEYYYLLLVAWTVRVLKLTGAVEHHLLRRLEF